MGEGMKTPEEIKKGLKCCARLKFPNAYCDGCSYLVKAAENLWECKSLEILTDALAYIQQLEAQVPKWISVEERLPEEGQDVLVSVNGGLCVSHIFGFDMMTGEPEWTYTGLGADPDHWMPLPPAPKEG